MSQPFFFADEDAFHRAQRARLLDRTQMPPFEGLFAKEVVTQMHRLLPGQLQAPRDASALLGVFQSVPRSDIPALFFVVEEALSQCKGKMDESATRWALELASYSAMRCVDFKVWAGVPVSAKPGEGKVAHGLQVRGLSDQARLLSTLVMAGLSGQVLTLGPGKAPANVFVLELGSESPVDHWVAKIYDDVYTEPTQRRTNLAVPLTPDQLARLRAHIKHKRIVGRQWCAAHADTSGLAEAEAQQVLWDLAGKLDLLVVEEKLDPRGLFAGMSFGDLQAYLERVLKVMPEFVAPAGTPAAPPATPAPPPSPFAYDAFVSHASEDKGLVVQPLVTELKRQGFRIWYDRESMRPGDLLSSEINKALASSRVIVLVLSPDYFKKPWAQAEMEAAHALEMANPSGAPSRLLCIWHGVDAEFVLGKVPMLASRIGIPSRDGIQSMADKVAHALRPGL